MEDSPEEEFTFLLYFWLQEVVEWCLSRIWELEATFFENNTLLAEAVKKDPLLHKDQISLLFPAFKLMLGKEFEIESHV